MPRFVRAFQKALFVGALYAICAMGLHLRFCQAAEVSDAVLQRVPVNAQMVVVLENPTAASGKWLQTAFGKLITGNSFAPFMDAVEQQNLACPLHLRPWLGVDWADLSKQSEPAALFAISDLEKNAAVCLVITTKTPAEAAELAGAGQAYFQSRKAKITVKKLADGELRVFEVPAGAGAAPQVRVHAIQGNRFIAASSRSAADIVLEQGKKGAATSVLQNKQFVATRTEAAQLVDSGKPEMFAYLDPVGLAEVVDASPSYQASLQNQAREAKRRRARRDWLSVVKRQGLNSFKAIGVAAALRPGTEMDLELHGTAIAVGPYKDSMRMFSFVPGAPSPIPGWIDGTALHYSYWFWNFPVAVEGLASWGDELSGGEDAKGNFEDILGSLKSDPNGPQVDLRKEVFANLGPRVAETIDEKGVANADNPRGKRFVQQMQIAAGKTAILEKAFDKLFAENIKLGECKKVLIDGQPAWQALKQKGLFDSTATPDEQEPGLAPEDDDDEAKSNRKKASAQLRFLVIGKTDLFVSSDLPLLTACLQNKPAAAGMAKDPRYVAISKRLAKWEGPESSMRWFGQFQKVLEPGYNEVKQGRVTATSSMQARLWQLLIFGTPESRAGQPVAKLPPYAAVEATMAPGGVHLSTSPTGFRFHAGTLAPASAK